MRLRSSSLLAAAAIVSLVSLCSISLSVPASAEEPVAEESLDTLAEKIAAAADAGAAPDEISESASLPLDGAGSLSFDDASRVSAMVFFEGAPSETTLALLSEQAQVDKVFERFDAAEIRVAPELLAVLAETDGIASVTPTLAPFVGSARSSDTLDGLRHSLQMNRTAQAAAVPASTDHCGPIPIEADGPLRADQARRDFSVDGAGVTIGIISDSLAQTTTPVAFEDDVKSGALPGAENPCGRTQEVTVLSDQRTDGSDEGRAMTQLVHGIAPGAKLLFADSGLSELGMAENIEALAEAGADIIVDDISWTSEAYYQQGIVSATIESVKQEHDVAYFTSAGNSTATSSTGPNEGLPHSSWQTNAYRPMECPTWVTVNVLNGSTVEKVPASEAGMDCMDFDPTDGAQIAYDTLTTRASQNASEYPLQVYGAVGEPMFGVSTMLQVQFYNELDPTADPEFIDELGMVGGPYASLSGNVAIPLNAKVRMVIVRAAHDPAAALPALYTQFIRGGDAIAERQFMGDNTHDWVGESVFGHAADGSAVSVGTTDWEAPTEMRGYSSLGPGTLLFERVATADPSARLAAPEIVGTPHVVAVDGTQTTFFGEDDIEDDQTVYRFSGTSAASPNAAAVAALALSYRPELTGSELTQFTIDTARDNIDGDPLTNPYASRFASEHVFGAGLVDALGLLEAIDTALPAKVPAAPSGLKSSQQTTDSITFVWDAPAARAADETARGSSVPVDHYVIALFEGDATSGNEIEASQLTDSPLPTSYRFTGLTPNTKYTVQLTAFGKGDRVGAAQTATASTLAQSDGSDGSDGADGDGNNTVNPGGKTGNTVNTGRLSNTGGSGDIVLWAGVAGAMLLLGAACAFAYSRRSARR